MIKLARYLKPFITGLIAAISLLFVQAICDLNLPNLMSDIVNVGIVQSDTGYIIRKGLLMLLITGIGGAASVLVGLLSTRIATGASKNIRHDLFAKVENFSSREFDKFSTASLITRSTNDVTQVQMLVQMGIRMLCYAPIMGVGGIIMALGKSKSMGWIIALAVIVLIGLIVIFASIAIPKFKIIQKLVDKLNLVTRENLSGLMVIRAFGTQEHETKRFRESNADLSKTSLFISRVMILMMPFMTIIMNGVSLLIIWVGARQIADSNMQVGDMMAFMQYAMQIIMSFLMISMMFIMVPRASVSGERIAEVLDAAVSVTDPASPKPFISEKRGLVEFKNVSFKYHGAEEYALADISFTARPGETTAIIGSTGSGKSTVASLLLRFYDASEGSVTVSGADVREVNQSDLRDRIGYVPQKASLLSGTIRSNLSYGKKDASDSELEGAAWIAQALEFIDSKPERFESEISQGAANVSGGQKQRLSIARALAKHPEIIIFDDSFSALDFKTDSLLRKALKEKTGDSTVIVVAQRVGTIMNAEQIIVLEKGRIAGRGTHSELIKSCPEYYEIASSQLSETEI